MPESESSRSKGDPQCQLLNSPENRRTISPQLPHIDVNCQYLGTTNILFSDLVLHIGDDHDPEMTYKGQTICRQIKQ